MEKVLKCHVGIGDSVEGEALGYCLFAHVHFAFRLVAARLAAVVLL